MPGEATVSSNEDLQTQLMEVQSQLAFQKTAVGELRKSLMQEVVRAVPPIPPPGRRLPNPNPVAYRRQHA